MTAPFNPVQVLERKRDGEALEPGELRAFLGAYLDNEVDDAQMAAFLMSVFFRGMAPEELVTLLDVMIHSGRVLDLSHLGAPRVDKHSTGGVGDKVSIPLAPLVAEAGIFVPMMSGRGLGHTGGTLDKLESIPGFRTNLSVAEFIRVLEAEGTAMIGQTEEIAPLDRRLYALRSVTATVPAIPLIAASILSKKLAEGLTGLVLDVKAGAGAFLTEPAATKELAQTLVRLARDHGVSAVARVTAMDRPLGRTVGNALEIRESIACLKGEGAEDLRALVIELAAEMIYLGEGAPDLSQARDRAQTLLDGGRPLERLARLIEAQGGDPRVIDDPSRLPSAPVTLDVETPVGGIVVGVDPRTIGVAVVELGGGRLRLNDEIHPGVGVDALVQPGDEIAPGGRLGRVHARTQAEATRAAQVLQSAVTLAPPGGEAEEAISRLLPLLGARIVP
jgi:pyrimidine-nucleoside phosphorylase